MVDITHGMVMAAVIGGVIIHHITQDIRVIDLRIMAILHMANEIPIARTDIAGAEWIQVVLPVENLTIISGAIVHQIEETRQEIIQQILIAQALQTVETQVRTPEILPIHLLTKEQDIIEAQIQETLLQLTGLDQVMFEEVQEDKSNLSIRVKEMEIMFPTNLLKLKGL